MKTKVYINQDSGYLMIDIINAERAHYDRQILITGRLVTRTEALHDSVIVENISMYNRAGFFSRFTSWLTAFFQIWWKVRTRYQNAELFIVSNPPLACFIPLLTRNAFSLLIYDVYPDAFVQYNILSAKNPIISAWKRANKASFKRARKLFTLSLGMKRLLSNYTDSEKIDVVPVWSSLSVTNIVQRSDNLFIRENGLNDQFIVMYSGNLGVTHSLEVIIDVAEAFKDYPIVFFIIGEGGKKAKLLDLVKKKNVLNVHFRTWQPAHLLLHSLSASDLSIVTLGVEASDLSIPSKTFDLIALGTPILGIASPKSELAHLIRNYDVGSVFSSNDVEQIISFVKEVYLNTELRSKFRQNATIAARNFTNNNAAKFILSDSNV